VRRAPDILDELVQGVMNESGSIEHVSADTVLKQHLTAASLRFPLPPKP
jgi:peptide chain release factor subunit 1